MSAAVWRGAGRCKVCSFAAFQRQVHSEREGVQFSSQPPNVEEVCQPVGNMFTHRCTPSESHKRQQAVRRVAGLIAGMDLELRVPILAAHAEGSLAPDERHVLARLALWRLHVWLPFEQIQGGGIP